MLLLTLLFILSISLVWTILWTKYFNKSIRVKNTFVQINDENQKNETPLAQIKEYKMKNRKFFEIIGLLSVVGSLIFVGLEINQNTCLLVGTWKDATWAIRFYEKFGFVLHTKKQTVQLLKKYWKIPLNQIENSVVLEK